MLDALNLLPLTVRYRCPMAARKLGRSLARLSLDGSYRDGVDDIFRFAAAGEIVRRPIKALQNRTDGGGAGEPFSQFISNISRLKIGKDQNVRTAADRRTRSLRLRDGRQQSCIGL